MNVYLTFKALHLIAVISWMAGLLYLPRIFVYHSETNDNKGQSETFKLMEKRLYFYIMNPAMILSWIFGLLLIHSQGLSSLSFLWMKIKLIVVLFLLVYVFVCQHILNLMKKGILNISENKLRFFSDLSRVVSS